MDNEDSDCVDAQADMSLHWVHMSEGMFYPVAAHSITVWLAYNCYMSIKQCRP